MDYVTVYNENEENYSHTAKLASEFIPFDHSHKSVIFSSMRNFTLDSLETVNSLKFLLYGLTKY
jgi:hypothetical protein